MTLEVFYSQDIKNAILAAEQGMGAGIDRADPNDQQAVAFKEGYMAALMTIALAFGLIPLSGPERDLPRLDKAKLPWLPT